LLSVLGTTHAMPFLKRNADEGFERLQALLLAMRAGDAVRIGEAAAVSGLSEDNCRKALEALARVGLMTCERDGRFKVCQMARFPITLREIVT
jgi:predicted transcriptional regulator